MVEIARLQEPSLDGKFANELLDITYRNFFFRHERRDSLEPPFPRPFGSRGPDKPARSKEGADDHSANAEDHGYCVVQRHLDVDSHQRQ